MSATTITARPRTTRPPRARGIVRLVIVLLVLGVIGGGLIGFHRFKAGILKQVTASIVAQLPTVATATATMRDWQPAQHATGTLRAARGADLSAEIGGIVDELNFDSGDEVAAGAPLLRLRPNDDTPSRGVRGRADPIPVSLDRTPGNDAGTEPATFLRGK